MMFRGQIVTLVCLFVCVHSASHSTDGNATRSNGTNVVGSQYEFCFDSYEDLSWCRSKDFDQYGTATRRNARLPNQNQIQCEHTAFCDLASAQIRRVTCYNQNVGWPRISWSCDAEFYGTQYELANSTVNCEAYRPGSTCVLKNSCIFYYSPRPKTRTLFIVSGVGGVIVLGLILFCVCLCVRRRNASAASGTTTTIIRTSPNASVPNQACVEAHGCPPAPNAYPAAPHLYAPAPHTYANAPGYPGQQDYPPPYAAPYPQYAPQYGPPEPTKQVHY